MEIATAAISAVVAKLGDLLREEYMLHKSLRVDIEFLNKEMGSMQDAISILMNTSEMRRKPSQFQLEHLVSKIRDLSYDMEDNLDEFIFHVQGKPREMVLGVGGLVIPKLKSMLAEVKARHKLDKQIQEIKLLSIKFEERHFRRYNKPIITSASVPAEGELKEARTSCVGVKDAAYSASEADASTLVGVDRPRDELISVLQLTGKEKDPELATALKVISVYGSGGMGKTTLARVVYEEIRPSFDCSAWVPLSRKPNMANVLMGILRQVEDRHNKAADGNGKRDIIIRIRNSLQGKRYYILPRC